MDIDFSPADYDLAARAHDLTILAELVEHPSRFIRARVAGNHYISRKLRDRLRTNPNEHTGVLGWLISNPAFTAEEYREVFATWQGRGYDGNIHLNLASSEHATIEDLTYLLKMNNWGVTLAVLNNTARRADLPPLIKHLLPDEDKPWEKWSDLEKLAYFRTHGRRFRN